MDEQDITSPHYVPSIPPALRWLPIRGEAGVSDGITGNKKSSRLPFIDLGIYYPKRDRVKTIPALENNGGVWRTLPNRPPVVGDIAQTNQHEKLLQTINNNQQFHTVITITPVNSDPMQVAQLVYQKFQHASMNGNKSVVSIF